MIYVLKRLFRLLCGTWIAQGKCKSKKTVLVSSHCGLELEMVSSLDHSYTSKSWEVDGLKIDFRATGNIRLAENIFTLFITSMKKEWDQ